MYHSQHFLVQCMTFNQFLLMEYPMVLIISIHGENLTSHKTLTCSFSNHNSRKMQSYSHFTDEENEA